MSGTYTAKELGALRKNLQKAELEVLQDGRLVSQAIDTLSSESANDLALDLLFVHLTLHRQLRFIFEDSTVQGALTVATIVHSRLAPLFLPGGPAFRLLLSSFESPIRVQASRATEVLAAAGRMVECLPPPSSSASTSTNLLVPFFHHVAASRTLSRVELNIISILIAFIPTQSIPSDLLGRLLAEIETLDSASVRANIIANILLRNRDSSPYKITQPISHLFAVTQPASTLLNLTRYLLPILFESRPSVATYLLDLISEEYTDNLSAWIAVGSLSVSLGIIDISDLSHSSLAAGISHEDALVRTRAFQLFAGSKHLLRVDVLDLIRQSLRYNAVIPSAGGRSEFCSAVHAFFKKLREVQDVIRKISSTDPRLSLAESLHTWILEEFVDPGLSVSCRYPVVRSILALSVLRTYLDLLGDKQDIQERVFTRDRVDSLFVCQMSEFTEVRVKARIILQNAKIPLPGYENLDSLSTQSLLQSALTSLNHPRKVQAEAGKSTLCILFQKLLCQSGSQPQAIRFVHDLLDQLENHVKAAEKDLAVGMEKMPLHGIIAAVRDVMSCIQLVSADDQSAWKPLFLQTLVLVDRIWLVTRAVISLAPSRQAEAEEKPDHEIARAYEVLGAGDEEDGEEAMDHTNLLSGCWRATKEAAELLATSFIEPIKQVKTAQSMWTSEEVDHAGQRFLIWMHEIRHRGTFSKIALAFTDLVDTAKAVETLKPLCQSWLEHELDIITTDSLSTTRRSAALPYSVLAIVSSDAKLLDLAFDRLNELARVDNSESSYVTKVHAFNILKIVLLDARQSNLLDRYFERAVVTALHAFSSPNWNVRNVGLILFSTLVHRSLSSARGTQDFYASRPSLATRQTLASWNAKYPAVIPYLVNYLKEQRSIPSNAHSPLFPILIIVRSLRWSDAGAQIALYLYELVETYLSSPEWQVRGVAAQALSSLVSSENASKIVSTLHIQEKKSFNAIHGRLLFIRHLIAEVIDWKDVDQAGASQIESALLTTVASGDKAHSIPLIGKAIIDCLTAYMDNAQNAGQNIGTALSQLSHMYGIRKVDTRLPGHSLLSQTCADDAIRHGESADAMLRLLDTTTTEEYKITTLGRLLSAGIPDARPTSALLHRVMSLCTSLSESDDVRLAALNALVEGVWAFDVSDRMTVTEGLAFSQTLSEQYLSTRSVILKEATLAALGWALAWRWRCDPQTRKTGLGDLTQFLEWVRIASVAEQSQPSRYSALRAFCPFADALFPTSAEDHSVSTPVLVSFHRLILQFLQDDDEEIRSMVADLIRQGRNLAHGICWQKAIELEWEYLDDCMKWYQSEQLLKLVWEAFADVENTNIDIEQMRKSTKESEVLFEIEPPNLFRDPLVDVDYCSRILATLKDGNEDLSELSEKSHGLRKHHNHVESIIENSASASPLDRAFDARRRASQRIKLQRPLLAGFT